MTIGIAAFGPNAGRAVAVALAAVERVGRGALGGFVSFVAITQSGAVKRAEIQRGGSAALFGDKSRSMPDGLAEARIAGLMSSGPDRPAPLSQFTPADPAIGLITGHRMPNTIGAGGFNLNDEVLNLMRRGSSPFDAVDAVVRANPEVDAGIVALAIDGRMHFADTPYVQRRGDVGRAMIGGPDQGAAVAVLHNAIRPHRPIATLAAEVAMDIMLPEDREDAWITFRRGTPLIAGTANAVNVADDGAVASITVDNPKFLVGLWSLGIGYETQVFRTKEAPAVMLYEPYMIIQSGRLQTIDGQAQLTVPIQLR